MPGSEDSALHGNGLLLSIGVMIILQREYRREGDTRAPLHQAFGIDAITNA